MKNIHSFYVLFFSFFLISSCQKNYQPDESTLSAFHPKINVLPNYNNLIFQQFTTDNGLSSNVIYDIFQSKDGYIWFATSAGLDRFDGYTVTNYRHNSKDPYSIAENEIFQIDEDSKGNLWIQTASKGIVKFDRDANKFYNFDEKSSFTRKGSAFQQLLVDNQDRVWTNNPLTRFDPQTEQFTLVSEISFRFIKEIDNHLYCCTDYMLEIDPERLVLDTLFKCFDYGVNDLEIDKQGNFWVASQETGLWLYEKKIVNNEVQFILNENIDSMVFRKQGQKTIISLYYDKSSEILWVGAWGALIEMDLGTKDYPLNLYRATQSDPHSLISGLISDILIDHSDNLWITTQNGISRFIPSKHKMQVVYQKYGDTTSLSNSVIKGLWDDGNGKLWMGTQQGLHCLDRSTNKIVRYPYESKLKCNDHLITNIQGYEDKLYITYWGAGLVVFDIATKKYRPIDFRKIDKFYCRDFFWDLVVDSSRNCILTSSWNNEYLLEYNIGSNDVMAFFLVQDMNGKKSKLQWTTGFIDYLGWFWIANEEQQGVLAMDFNNRRITSSTEKDFFNLQLPINHYFSDENDSTSISDNTITCFFEDEQKRLWLGSAAGLNLFHRETKTFTHYGTLGGFENEYIAAITDDDNGFLWISTYNGLCKFDKDKKTVVKWYDKNDGLQGSQFEFNSVSKNKKGELFFGGFKGLNYFHPDSIYENTTIPNVVISDILVNGKPHPFSNQLVLPHDSNTIEIRFAALDFSNPESNKFSYKLFGVSERYSIPNSSHSASYRNLNQGEYLFHLKGSNNDGVWNTKGIKLEIEILPAWWETWWFRISALCLFSFLIYKFVKLRLKNIIASKNRKLNIQLLEMNQVIGQIKPHFIDNALNSLQGFIENKDFEKADKHLVQLSKILRRFISSFKTENQGDEISVKEISLEDEIDFIDNYIMLEKMRFEGKFEYEINIDQEIETDEIRIPPFLIQPFVENAIKHGFKGYEEHYKLRIGFFMENEVLHIEIEDNGIGREAAQKSNSTFVRNRKSYGTKIIKKWVETLNQIGYKIQLDISDAKVSGTMVHINLILENE